MSEPAYLALDPGDTVGWANFDEGGNLLGIGQVPELDFNRWLDKHIVDSLKMVIIEDYKNHGHMNQPKWSRNKTSKKIGAIEVMCDLRGVEYILQPNTVKSIGYMWGNMQQPKNHKISHQYDAYAHGVFYLQSAEIVPAGFYLKPKEKETRT